MAVGFGFELLAEEGLGGGVRLEKVQGKEFEDFGLIPGMACGGCDGGAGQVVVELCLPRGPSAEEAEVFGE